MSQRMAAGGIMQHQNGDSGENRFIYRIATCKNYIAGIVTCKNT